METKTFTFDEYKDLCDDYCGVCLECGEIADGVEPDAENYLCDVCDCNKVMGLELALVCGHINLE